MKILTILSLVTTLLNPFNGVKVLNETTGVTNSTGNSSFNNTVQVTYNYSVASPSATIGASFYATVEQEVPLVYLCDIYINFQDTVDMAYIKLTFNKPVSGSTYYGLDFVGQNIRIDSSGNTTSNSFMYLYVYETNSAHVQIVFSLAQIINNYNYPSPTTTVINQGVSGILGSEWINKGGNYFRVQTAQMTSCVLDTEIDYTSYIDGLETSVNSVNNTLTQINTNIDGVETLITNLLSTTEDIENAINNIHNIEWTNIPVTYKGYTTDFATYDNTSGQHNAGYYVYEGFYIYEPNKGMFMIEVPIGNTSVEWANIKLYTYYNNDVHRINVDNYIMFKNRYSIVIYYFVNDSYETNVWPNGNNPLVVYVDKPVYYYNNPHSMNYLLQNDERYWELYNTIVYSKKLDDILKALNNMSNSNLHVEELDPTFLETINDGVTDNLDLIENPTVPEKLIGTLNYFTSPYLDFINNPKLSIYKYGILLSLIVSLFKVVTR